jgi:ABC-type Zn uptake system ZnuABC Zn-binding protein ZnuA
MILICLCPLALLAGGCRNSADDADIVATTAIAADIARHVAGADATVDQLIPGSASPHSFTASAQDRAELENAQLVVAWGPRLEEGLPLKELDNPPFEFSAGDPDPHVWMDPTLVADALPKLADTMGDADPDHRDGYRRRAQAYGRRLRALDRELRQTLSAIPPERRKLVTSHDALGHFVERYGFDFVGAPFGLSPESEPSAEKVASLIDAIKAQHVPAVFVEETDNPRLMEQIAREAHVEIVDDLLVEGLSSEHSSYEDILRYDARRIVEALAK